MSIIWFLGMPGAGKTVLGNRFAKMIGVPCFDGDDYQTDRDRELIEKMQFTQEHRDAQLSRIIDAVCALGRCIVTHPLPNPESRAWAHAHDGTLVYVRAPVPLVHLRLKSEERRHHHFRPEMLRPWILRHWVEPEHEGCFVINNTFDNTAVNERLGELRSLLC